ncbi:MAG TPA: thioredoxin family protein [Chitinophagaceae bacterium]|nr:thioredoxin family protein [Chitinophagaceae bacterium]
MKSIIIIATSLLLSLTGWQTNFEKAKESAREQHKLVLLNFSGSDWCGPCIKMRKDIFDSPSFTKMADSLLVLVNADFPRSRKNQLSKELQQQNDQLAEKYNQQGIFPLTVLLDENGKALKTWQGLPKDAAGFIEEIKSLANARK